MMKLYVKYMVSLRCKLMVKAELKKLGLHPIVIDLGMVKILEDLTDAQHEQLKINLRKSGLELLDDKRKVLVDSMKEVIIDLIYHRDGEQDESYSQILSEKLDHDYTTLATMFSEVQGITVQQFVIRIKVERIKELLLYEKLTLSEIAYLLNYSSAAHLSNQFKKVTGLTPSYFKRIGRIRNRKIENV